MSLPKHESLYLSKEENIATTVIDRVRKRRLGWMFAAQRLDTIGSAQVRKAMLASQILYTHPTFSDTKDILTETGHAIPALPKYAFSYVVKTRSR